MATPLDITVVANNTSNVEINVLDNTGTPVNMTGFTATWQVKDPKNNTALITKKTSDASLTLNLNIASFTINPTDTVNLQHNDYKEYVHELIIVNTLSQPLTITNNDPRLSWGKFTVRRQFAVPQ